MRWPTSCYCPHTLGVGSFLKYKPFCWQILDEKALGEMSVSVAMAEGLLQVLRNRFEGSTLSDLLNSQIYTKYGLQPDALSGSSQSHSSTLDPEEESKSEATFSEEETESPKVKAEPLKAEAEPVKGKTEPPMAQSDSQLFNQLLVTEGMALPPGMKEAASGESGAGRGGQRGGSKSWVPPQEKWVVRGGHAVERDHFCMRKCIGSVYPFSFLGPRLCTVLAAFLQSPWKKRVRFLEYRHLRCLTIKSLTQSSEHSGCKLQ